ncbi:hypothetical protein [Rubritalea tangerina]|uniref:Uncharacterized protein n=1 Tax=Rubritalea tangerina TaxID=430798 RepID=A0ABW4Z826_9BACT
MSLFDVLFPEIATASHLRTIAETNSLRANQARIQTERANILARANTIERIGMDEWSE